MTLVVRKKKTEISKSGEKMLQNNKISLIMQVKIIGNQLFSRVGTMYGP